MIWALPHPARSHRIGHRPDGLLDCCARIGSDGGSAQGDQGALGCGGRAVRPTRWRIEQKFKRWS